MLYKNIILLEKKNTLLEKKKSWTKDKKVKRNWSFIFLFVNLNLCQNHQNSCQDHLNIFQKCQYLSQGKPSKALPRLPFFFFFSKSFPRHCYENLFQKHNGLFQNHNQRTFNMTSNNWRINEIPVVLEDRK